MLAPLAGLRTGLAAALTVVPFIQGWLACVALAISCCVVAVGRTSHCPFCIYGLSLSPVAELGAAIAAFCAHRGARRREAGPLRTARWLNLLCVPPLLLAAYLLWRGSSAPGDCQTPALFLAVIAASSAACCLGSARVAHIALQRGPLGYGMLLGRCTPFWETKRSRALRWNRRRHSWSECPPYESITCLSPVMESPLGEGLDMFEFRL